MDLKTIHVSELDDSFQIRETTNEDTILKYCEQMKGYEGYGSFPPLRVVDVCGTLKIADGIHRYRAAKLAGLEEVPCEVIPGDEDTLFELSTRENLYHGLQMSRAEQKKVREKVIIHFWPKRHHTPEMLAKMLGVGHMTIRRQIDDLEKAGLLEHIETIIGSDGREMPTKQNKSSKVPNGTLPSTPGTPLKPDSTSHSTLHTPHSVSTVPEGYVRCAVCGEVYPESLEEAADSVCEKVYDHETGKYVHLCGEACRLKYQTCPDSETPWEAEPEPEPEPEPTSHYTPHTPHYVNDELDDDYEPGGEYVPMEEEEPEPEVYREVKDKPEKKPATMVGFYVPVEVEDCETYEEAVEQGMEFFRGLNPGTRVKISKIGDIYNININIHDINNILNHDNINNNHEYNINNNITPNFREKKTEFFFKLAGNRQFYLGVEKLEEFKRNYPMLDVEQVIRDCMIWNNSGSGSALVPFQKLYQRINTFLITRRNELERQKRNSSNRPNKFGVYDESDFTKQEYYE